MIARKSGPFTFSIPEMRRPEELQAEKNKLLNRIQGKIILLEKDGSRDVKRKARVNAEKIRLKDVQKHVEDLVRSLQTQLPVQKVGEDKMRRFRLPSQPSICSQTDGEYQLYDTWMSSSTATLEQRMKDPSVAEIEADEQSVLSTPFPYSVEDESLAFRRSTLTSNPRVQDFRGWRSTLVNVLEELKDQQFESMKFIIRDDWKIPRSKLDGRRVNVAEVMIQTWGEEACIIKIRDIMKQIPLLGLVERRITNTKKPVNGMDVEHAVVLQLAETVLLFEKIRIVLIGFRRAGKNKIGNAILGKKAFTYWNTQAQDHCLKHDNIIFGRRITLIRVPGWSQKLSFEDNGQQNLRQVVKDSMRWFKDGPHVIILVVKMNSTLNDTTRDTLEKLLGSGISEHTLVFSTDGEKILLATMNDHCAGKRQTAIDRCRKRYHLFKRCTCGKQNMELIETIEQFIVKKNAINFCPIGKEPPEPALQVEQLVTLVDRLCQKISALSASISRLKSDTKMEANKLKMMIALKNEEIEELQDVLRKKEEVLRKMREERERLESDQSATEISVLHGRIKQLEDEGIHRENKLQTMTEENDILKEELKVKHEEIKTLKKENQELKDILFQNQRQKKQIQASTRRRTEAESYEMYPLHSTAATSDYKHKTSGSHTEASFVDLYRTELIQRVVSVDPILDELLPFIGSDKYSKCDTIQEKNNNNKRKSRNYTAKPSDDKNPLLDSKEIQESAQYNPLVEEGNSGPLFKELQLVVIGSHGSGKSDIGNAIFRKNMFTFLTSFGGHYVKKTRTVLGTTVTLVRVPGWSGELSLDAEHRELRQELKDAVSSFENGPHAIILAIKMKSTITDTTQKTLEKLLTEKIWDHTIIILTRGHKQNVEETINRMKIRPLIKTCGKRFCVLSNPNSFEQSKTLVEEIALMVAEKNARSYPLHFCVDEIEPSDESHEKNNLLKRLQRKITKLREHAKTQGVFHVPNAKEIDLEDWYDTLVKIMSELSDQQLQKVKGIICNRGQCKIPRGHVEGQSANNLAKIMIEHWGERQCIINIRDILKDIPRNDKNITDLIIPFLQRTGQT
ncbi:hypothetical protein NFI96_016733 [Prochilodus magdalenae]|nr:hypothetical protein NFI96_016733 [Prochilodus magdalenae]